MINSQIVTLKEAQQDFEYYPTTNEIIAALQAHLKTNKRYSRTHSSGVLDIGAGTGKVLAALDITPKFAIEKSPILAAQLPDKVTFTGASFEEQSLYEKPVDFTFSNPPYSDYVNWTVKILNESSSQDIYLVIPQRWQTNPTITAALADRHAETTIVGEFDFLNSEDRKARAKVHLLHIFTPARNRDRFNTFIDARFPKPPPPKPKEDIQLQKNQTDVTEGPDFLARLVSAYRAELNTIQTSFDAIMKLDFFLLKSLEVDANRIATILRSKISTLKNDYWKRIFDHMSEITDRLIASKRKAMVQTLIKKTHLDFTEENVRVIAAWVIRHAATEINAQLLITWERMISVSNTSLYQSNRRTFEKGDWRFRNDHSLMEAIRDGKITKLKLELRIVAHWCGGSWDGQWSYEDQNGLNERAHDFLNDLRVVAINLGYLNPTPLSEIPRWEPGKPRLLEADHPQTGERMIIARVKAHLNQNLHIQFDQRFLLSLNCEYGKLKGWLLNAPEAAKELDTPLAAEIFHELPTLALPETLALPAA